MKLWYLIHQSSLERARDPTLKRWGFWWVKERWCHDRWLRNIALKSPVSVKRERVDDFHMLIVIPYAWMVSFSKCPRALKWPMSPIHYSRDAKPVSLSPKSQMLRASQPLKKLSWPKKRFASLRQTDRQPHERTKQWISLVLIMIKKSLTFVKFTRLLCNVVFSTSK